MCSSCRSKGRPVRTETRPDRPRGYPVGAGKRANYTSIQKSDVRILLRLVRSLRHDRERYSANRAVTYRYQAPAARRSPFTITALMVGSSCKS